MSQRLSLKAPAKVNLTLEVVRRRPDGYHEVALLLQTVSLFDTLHLEEDDGLSLTCTEPGLANQDNLVLQAAELLRWEAGAKRGARMHLEKEIPMAAGLGGGSSDAAAALVGLNRLWGLGLDRETLVELGARLGSDVPFFLHGGTALCTGRGERVDPLPRANLPRMVLLCPDIHVERKTATLYSLLPRSRYTSGALTFKLAGRIRAGGDVPDELLFNAFDEVAREVFPSLESHSQAMLQLGAPAVHLSGTGPSLYALMSRREEATALRALLAHGRGWRAYVVEPWWPPEPSCLT